MTGSRPGTVTTVLELARYAVERRLRGIAALSVLLVGLALATGAFFPSVAASAPELEAYVENLPPAFRAAFGIETFATIEGFLATEFYQFAWVLLLGMYFAYRAGSAVAGDVETDRIELLLALPISRGQLVGERYLAMVPAMVAVNVAGIAGVMLATTAVGEGISLADLLAVHLLSLPYFLACAGLGLVLSVLVSRADHANRGAIGLVFGLFLLDSLAAASAFEWIGAVSPTRYFDPTAVLVASEYDLVGGTVLLGVAVGLVVLSIAAFRRRDLE